MKGTIRFFGIVAFVALPATAWSQTLYGPLNTVPAPKPATAGTQTGVDPSSGGTDEFAEGGEGVEGGEEGAEGGIRITKGKTAAGKLLNGMANNIVEGAKETVTEVVKEKVSEKVGGLLGKKGGGEEEDLSGDEEEVAESELENPAPTKDGKIASAPKALATPAPTPSSRFDAIIQKNNADIKKSMDDANERMKDQIARTKFDKETGKFTVEKKKTRLELKKEEIEEAGGKWKETGGGAMGIADFDGEETKRLGRGTVKTSAKEVYDSRGNKIGKQTTEMKHSNGFLGLGQKRENPKSMHKVGEQFSYDGNGEVIGRQKRIEDARFRRNGTQKSNVTQIYNYDSAGNSTGATHIRTRTSRNGITHMKSQAYDLNGNKLAGRSVNQYSTQVTDKNGLTNTMTINARNKRDFKRQLNAQIHEKGGGTVTDAKLQKQLDRKRDKNLAREAARKAREDRRKLANDLKNERAKLAREDQKKQRQADREALATKRRVDRERKQLIKEGKDPSLASADGKKTKTGQLISKVNPFKKKDRSPASEDDDSTVGADGKKKKGFLGGIFKKKDKTAGTDTSTTKEKKGLLGGLFKKKGTATASTSSSTKKSGSGLLKGIGGLFKKKGTTTK